MTLAQDLIQHLTAANKPLSTNDLAELTMKKATYISRVLKELYTENQVQRLPGAGNGYMWAMPGRTFSLLKPVKGNKRINDNPTRQRMNINPETLSRLLVTWSEKKWQPKVTESLPNLPYALSRLFELAAEARYGSLIPQKELDYLKQNVQRLVTDAEALYAIVTSIYELPQLWEAENMAQFLLHPGTDPVEIRDLAIKMRELNK